jgi:hypothetical protein
MHIINKLHLSKLNSFSKRIKSFMNSITINNESFICEGKNIQVRNGTILVDGKVIKEGLSGDVTIHFNGDLASLTCADAVINGNVRGNVSAADVKCGDVGGNVNAADVRCGNVSGKINAASVKIKKNKGDVNM